MNVGNTEKRYVEKLLEAIPTSEKVEVLTYYDEGTPRTRQLILFNLWYRGRHQADHDILAGVRPHRITHYKIDYHPYHSD